MNKIGITTTVPIEILLAAGFKPVDLNNLFITSPLPEKLIGIAEKDGFPLNCCSWIKGIYGACVEFGIENIICVTGGDCSNTIMLMEVLKQKGLKTISFAYPDQPDIAKMTDLLENLACTLGTTVRESETIREELIPVRQKALKLDRITWQEGKISGWENHYWLVSASDFNQDISQYLSQVTELISDCRHREPYPEDLLRIAYVGVPPIYGRDFYDFIETCGARVVFNETQRQFAMLDTSNNLAEQYSNYTYPYSIVGRIRDIRNEIKRRKIDAVIHYMQAFCHRAIGDIIFRHSLDLPILTLEGNNEFTLSQQLQTRIEAFIDILKYKKKKLLILSGIDNTDKTEGGLI